MGNGGAAVTGKLKASDVGDSWRTPDDVIAPVLAFCAMRGMPGIALDPCGGPGSLVTARAEICPPGDGLAAPWHDFADSGLVFVNPPYSNPGPWVAKAEASGCEVICLVPNATETRWWSWAPAVCFWRGRLTFLDPNGEPHFPARQGSALLYFGPEPALFEHVFSSCGHVVRR